jgi:hypothetical protein
MQKALVTCTAAMALSMILSTAALAGKKKIVKREDTIYGAISCSVPQAPPAAPAPGAAPAPAAPAAPGAPPAPGAAPASGSPPTPGAPPAAPAPGATQRPTDSIQQCLDRRGKVVILSEEDGKGIPVENPDPLRGHEGHRVSASGYMNGDSFHVISVRII